MRIVARIFVLAWLVSAAASAAKIPTPSESVGFEVGADRQLADYRQISAYFRTLAAASPRVQRWIRGEDRLARKTLSR